MEQAGQGRWLIRPCHRKSDDRRCVFRKGTARCGVHSGSPPLTIGSHPPKPLLAALSRDRAGTHHPSSDTDGCHDEQQSPAVKPVCPARHIRHSSAIRIEKTARHQPVD